MNGPIRKGTVCFLRQGENILLALIEYGPADRKWNGIGGFANDGETLEEAVVREAIEETYIELQVDDLKKVAELNGSFQLNIFMTNKWGGEFKVKEPSLKDLRWFPKDHLPYAQMHPGTEKWMSRVLEGKLIRGTADGLKEVIGFE